MCHQITWYHALCSHQNQSYNLPIVCKKAVKLGYECWNPECVVLPIIGKCSSCKSQTHLAKGCFSLSAAAAGKDKYSDDDSLSTSPYTPDAFSDILFDENLERESAIGDDSGIYINDGEDVVDWDGHETGLELFDKITF